MIVVSWTRHVTLTLPFSTEVYKWVSANLMLGVALQWTSISSGGGGGEKLNAPETGEKGGPEG